MSKNGTQPLKEKESKSESASAQFTPLLKAQKRTYTRQQILDLQVNATPMSLDLENKLRGFNILR